MSSVVPYSWRMMALCFKKNPFPIALKKGQIVEIYVKYPRECGHY